MGSFGCVKSAGYGLGLSIVVSDISLLLCANDRKHEIRTAVAGKPDQGSSAPPYTELRNLVTKLQKSLLPEFFVSLLDRGKALIDLRDFGFALFSGQSSI